MSERDDLTEQAFHTPAVKADGEYVEMGGQLFTKAEWAVVEAYAKGHTISALQEEDRTAMQAQVKEFHEAFGAPASDRIRVLPEERVGVRIELLREEFQDELIPALHSGDLVETADACVDILYVTFGLLVEMGIDAKPLFDEVHRSNMSKLGADGKPIISRGMELDGFYEGRVMKGPGYFRPDLAGILALMIDDEAIARGEYSEQEIYGVGGKAGYLESIK